MKKKKYLITGGCGFLGSSLVRRLVQQGHEVRILDDVSRGSLERLADIQQKIEVVQADIRDPKAVSEACDGMETVCHLAYINGTEFFYSRPGLVLEVAVKGMMNVLEGCRQHSVQELLLVSSSEVYQTPPQIPTPETVPLCVPDPQNPRYSYGGGKIISELLALHLGKTLCPRVLIVRPHNVYGPAMGWEHVIPQFALRMKALVQKSQGPISFPIQGTGEETRSFVYIDDFTEGVLKVLDRGQHLQIYHVGTMEEISMARLAEQVGAYFKRAVHVVPGALQPGSTLRRCPDISKIKALGYVPQVLLADGLPRTVEWYDSHADRQPKK